MRIPNFFSNIYSSPRSRRHSIRFIVIQTRDIHLIYCIHKFKKNKLSTGRTVNSLPKKAVENTVNKKQQIDSHNIRKKNHSSL